MDDAYFVAIADKIFRTRLKINSINFNLEGDVKCCTTKIKERLLPICIHRSQPKLVLWNNKTSNFKHIYVSDAEYDFVSRNHPDYLYLLKTYNTLPMGKTFKDCKNYNPEEAKRKKQEVQTKKKFRRKQSYQDNKDQTKYNHNHTNNQTDEHQENV